jgi:transaldolase
MSFDFFIDTVDIGYIEEKLKLMFSQGVSKRNILGITSNPSAFQKEGLKSIRGWKERTQQLCKLTTSFKPSGDGIVYVQAPSDSLTNEELLLWKNIITSWSDGITRVGLKIPPYKKYIEMIPLLKQSGVSVNVTGIADASTALFCALQTPDWVSVIPGRMGEVGLDYKSHLSYLTSARGESRCRWRIITGSMRTLDNLKECVELGTVPTIGKHILNLVDESNCKEIFGNGEVVGYEALNTVNCPNFSPVVKQKSTDLSVAFFNQMNDCSKEVAEELRMVAKCYGKVNAF